MFTSPFPDVEIPATSIYDDLFGDLTASGTARMLEDFAKYRQVDGEAKDAHRMVQYVYGRVAVATWKLAVERVIRREHPEAVFSLSSRVLPEYREYERAMTTLVDDAAGQIYGTKRGELRIVANTGDKATWRKGKKVEELVVLEPSDNLYLIYRELGIYGQLGSICDDE